MRLSERHSKTRIGRLWHTLELLRDEGYITHDAADAARESFRIQIRNSEAEDIGIIKNMGFADTEAVEAATRTRMGIRFIEQGLELIEGEKSKQRRKLEDESPVNVTNRALEDWWIWVFAALAMVAAVGAITHRRQRPLSTTREPASPQPLLPSVSVATRWSLAVVVEATSLADLQTGSISTERASALLGQAKYFLAGNDRRWDANEPSLAFVGDEIDRTTRDFILVVMAVSEGPPPDRALTTMALRSRVLVAKNVHVTRLAKLAAPPDPSTTDFIRV